MKAPKQPELKYRKNSTKAWKRAHPSAPGETPNVQTGTLKRSIQYAMDRMVAKVGSILKPDKALHSYAWYLEHGTRGMAPRPYLRRALFGKQQQIRRLLMAS